MSWLTLEMSREAKRESKYSAPITSASAGLFASRVVWTWGLRNGMQITVRKSYATMLCRTARSRDWLVSVNKNSEFDFIASSRIECEIVLSSSKASPFEFRPAASRKFPSSSFRKTYPRSARISFKVVSTSVTRISSSTPTVLSFRAASRNNVSFSRSVVSVEI